MSDGGPGPLVGAGRLADVYDLGDGTVLRRYRTDDHDTEQESEVMRWVGSHRVPVPDVHRARPREIVMEKVEGPTMSRALDAAPWKARRFARMLARLQALLATVPAPDWLLAPGFSAGPGGDRVLHLGLHPGNVILSPTGPVIIDWTDAAGGPPGFDAAMTYVELSTHPAAERADQVVGWVMPRLFRSARGRALIDPYVDVACDHRLADPLLDPAERTAVAEYRRRRRGAPGP